MGSGYPSIDSLKTISEFFSVTIDELLSNGELISLAERDSQKRTQQMRDLVFGLLDCSVGMLFLIPFFGQRGGDFIYQVSLLSLKEEQTPVKAAYITIALLTVIWGIAALAMQNYQNSFWMRSKNIISSMLSILGVLIFMTSLQPYAAFYIFSLLVMKGVLLIKQS